MARFVLKLDGQQHTIRPSGLRIGRGPGNDVALSDGQVSQRHTRVWMQSGSVYIEDLQSMNGTFVNDVQISEPRVLQPGDQIRVGHTTMQLALVPGAGQGSQSSFFLPLIIIVGFAIVLTVVALFIMRRGATFPGAGQVYPTAYRPPSAPIVLDPLERARLATVLIIALDSSGDEVNGGSGSIVDPRGYILTNSHVLEGGDSVAVFVNSPDQNARPQAAFLAQVVSRDASLDLALLQVVAQSDGGALSATPNLSSVPLGDSDKLRIGDEITILGFPEVGGVTVTLTKGSVSGFHEDGLGHERGWIKTDAEVSPGNSGGMAINEKGELVGVPTFVSAEAQTLGRIGGLRPINLAGSLLNQIP